MPEDHGEGEGHKKGANPRPNPSDRRYSAVMHIPQAIYSLIVDQISTLKDIAWGVSVHPEKE